MLAAGIWLMCLDSLSDPSAAATTSDAHALDAVALRPHSRATFDAVALLTAVSVEAEAFFHEASIVLGQLGKFLACALLVAVRHAAYFFVLAKALGPYAASLFNTFLVEILHLVASVSATLRTARFNLCDFPFILALTVWLPFSVVLQSRWHN